MARRLIEKKQGFKLYRDTEWDEYQVEHPTNKNATYHTDDKQDAFGTMDLMIAEHARNMANGHA